MPLSWSLQLEALKTTHNSQGRTKSFQYGALKPCCCCDAGVSVASAQCLLFFTAAVVHLVRPSLVVLAARFFCCCIVPAPCTEPGSSWLTAWSRRHPSKHKVSVSLVVLNPSTFGIDFAVSRHLFCPSLNSFLTLFMDITCCLDLSARGFALLLVMDVPRPGSALCVFSHVEC